MFWHSVIVTLGEVSSAAHRGGETRSRGCQLRLTITHYPPAFPSGLLFFFLHSASYLKTTIGEQYLCQIFGALREPFEEGYIKQGVNFKQIGEGGRELGR